MSIFDLHSIFEAREVLLEGAAVTIKIAGAGILCGLMLGTFLAVLSVVKSRPLNAVARVYISVFRSIPLVMLLLWFFLIVPHLLIAIFDIPPTTDIRLVSAMVAYSMLEGAFFAEIIRAGILGLPPGQFNAAQSLGMTQLQSFRYVILPQAFKAMVPILLTQAIVIFQDTSVVFVIALGDFFNNAFKIGQRNGALIEMLLFAGLVYWIICTTASVLVKLLEKRTRRA